MEKAVATEPAPLIQLLTQEQLAHLLAHLPAKERMGACSLVHSSWRAAANLTMAEITCHPKAVSSLSSWLQANCAKVPVRSISMKPKPGTWLNNHNSTDRLLLPVHQLHFLQSLTLYNIRWSPAAAPAAATTLPPAKPQPSSGSLRSTQGAPSSRTRQASQAASDSLSSLSSLACLDLDSNSVVLGGLSALTGLKELRCRGTRRYKGTYGMTADDIPGYLPQDEKQQILDSMFPDHSMPAFASAEAALVAALPHLGHSLTSLQLEDDISSQRVLAGLSSLTRLQRLLLLDTPASSFDGLPHTLTELRLSVRGPASTRAVHADTSAALAQLSSMCVLTLEGFSGLDTAVFSGMSSLRDLSLSRVTFVPAPAPGQLLFVSKLTALQSLSIKSSPIGQQDITAAEAAALTAPQQLTSLTVSGLGGKLQALQYSSMFPAGRRLSSLTGLQVGPSFLQDAAVVTQAAYCCVALTSLVLEWSSSGTAGAGAGPAAIPAVQLAAGVGALTCFGSLASLTLNAHHETLPGCIWGNLATLTDLRSLSVVSWRPDYGPVLALTRCQRLEKLTLEGWENEEVMAFECDIRLTSSTLDDKEATGGAPDVWRQLPSAVFEATRFQQFRAVDNEEFENVMDFMQTMTEAAELILRQLKERDREVRAAEARADQLQQQLLEAQRQLAALQR